MYSFKCGDDIKIKLKDISISQSKHIKFEECKKCLDWKKYQDECENYILRSINHEMNRQKIRKNFLNLHYLHYLYSTMSDVI